MLIFTYNIVVIYEKEHFSHISLNSAELVVRLSQQRSWNPRPYPRFCGTAQSSKFQPGAIINFHILAFRHSQRTACLPLIRYYCLNIFHQLLDLNSFGKLKKNHKINDLPHCSSKLLINLLSDCSTFLKMCIFWINVTKFYNITKLTARFLTKKTGKLAAGVLIPQQPTSVHDLFRLCQQSLTLFCLRPYPSNNFTLGKITFNRFNLTQLNCLFSC